MPIREDVWFSDDYAGAKMGDFDFYYGYEHTICPTHGNDATSDDCECEDNAWAFVAKHKGKEFVRFAPDETLEPYEALAVGLVTVFAKFAVIPK